MFKGFVSGQWSILPSSFYISVFTFSTRACTENANIIFVNRTSEWIHKWGKSKIVSKFNKELTSQEKERASAEGSELLGGGAGASMGQETGDQSVWPLPSCWSWHETLSPGKPQVSPLIQQLLDSVTFPGLYQLKSWSCCQTTSEINPGPTSGWKLAGPGLGPGSLFLICQGSAELANWHGTAEAVKSSPAMHVLSGLFTVACVPCPRPLFPKDTLPSLTHG